MEKHITIGIAGHVDHGKTALVQCLTGIDTDRLKEEKRRYQILGQATQHKIIQSFLTMSPNNYYGSPIQILFFHALERCTPL